MQPLGQLIVLDGVKVPVVTGATKLDVSPADRIVAGMPQIHRVMSPKSLSSLAEGGVSGNCRVTGEAFVLKGTLPSPLRKEVYLGKPALGFAVDDMLSSMAFQPGSLTKSYTAVAVVAIPDVTNRVNILMGYTGESAIITGIRYDITVDSPVDKRLIAMGSGNNAPHAEFVKPVGAGWAVVIADYDDATRKVSIAVNQTVTFDQDIKTVGSTATAESYFTVGYHGSVHGLRTSKVGDMYIFDQSLRGDAKAMVELTKLVAALKTEYGIA